LPHSPPPPSTSLPFPYTTLFRSPYIISTTPTPPPPPHSHRHGRRPGGRWWPPTEAAGPSACSNCMVFLFTFLSYTCFHLTLCQLDRKSTRLNSSHVSISYAVFCL